MGKYPKPNIAIFDTTMRDGELTPGVIMNLSQKIAIAELLESCKVDVMEVGYPGVNDKDVAEVTAIAKIVKQSIVCGLAGSNEREIEILGYSLKNAARGRINIFTNVNTSYQSRLNYQDILDLINRSITLAKNYCDDIQWSAFDAVRSDRDFLYHAIETAIFSGARTICIPDTLGSLDADQFSNLIRQIINQVNNIEQAIISVHCHNDRDLAVDNSLAAVVAGAQQVECSLNGLGARKGNANTSEIVQKLDNVNNYQININYNLVVKTSQLANQILSKN